MKLSLPLILLLGSIGCTKRGPSPETTWVPDLAPDLGSVVARVGSVPIYAREVEAQTIGSHATAREALDDLVALHLLAEKAHQAADFRPDWSDPELRSALAERLIERDIWPQVQRENVPDHELRSIYQKLLASFVHPRLVDVALLIVFTGPLMKGEPRIERAETAKALAAYLTSKHSHSPAEFESIASDPAWRERSISYRRTLQGLDHPFSAKVGAEVAKLKAAGDMTPLIEDEDGFFMATYAGERPPQNIAFAEARDQLRQSYYEHWRTRRIEDLAQKLAEGHRVESHPQLLNQAAAPGQGS